ncbi:hypothetical protein HKX48_006190 [Thoreauomyces humboldtii]|nr:hypothetical protein HKX48_006190 [Thoreauomyces humboldtii]
MATTTSRPPPPSHTGIRTAYTTRPRLALDPALPPQHHAYRLPAGVTTAKRTDDQAPIPTDVLPALHRPPGVIGPVRRDTAKRATRSRPAAAVHVTPEAVEQLIQELVAHGGASSTLDLADVEILVSNGLLPPMRLLAPAASKERFEDEGEEDDGALEYPYPPAPATEGPYRMPALSGSIRHQNSRLGALLALLNRAYGGEGSRDAAARGGRTGGRGQRTSQRGFTGDEPSSHNGFDRNLGEIQKLIERAKNLDDKGYSEALENDADHSRRNKKTDKHESHQQSSHHHQQQQQQMQLFDLLSENKPLAGRKPIRVIAADLAKRIEMLKTNQGEWDAFQTKISEYREADAVRARTAPADMIRQNKIVLSEMPVAQRRLRIASAREQRDRHRLEIRTRKKENDMQRWHEKVAALQKKKDVVEQMKKKEKEQMGRAQALQRKWFVLTAVASRMTIIRIVLEVRVPWFLFASRLIQRVYRKHMRRREEAKKGAALMTIAVVFRRYVARRREAQKHKASDAIRQFFRDVYDVSRLMKIVKKYRFSVVKAQHYVMSWHEMRNAQVKVLGRYWDKLEPLWWNQRKNAGGGMKKSNSSTDLDGGKDAKAKPKKTRSKLKKEDAVEKVPLKMTPAIKRNILLTDLIVRRKQYRTLIVQYEQDLIAYSASHKGAGGAPKRPVFKLLPPQPDMLVLIEKGFLEATSTGWR